MRTAFIEAVQDLVAADYDIWLVTGDLGFSVLEGFAERFPDRFLNAGVAEQTMIGLAAGVASQGPTVIAYSIANFPTFRALEQLRNDVAYPRLPVIVVAVGSGFSYGAHGSTHHAVEDIAAMRALPGVTIVSPGDPSEARDAIRALVDQRQPAYLRLGKAGDRPVPSEVGDSFQLGRPRCIRRGRHLTIFATGSILAVAHDAVARLSDRGIDAALWSVHTLEPFDGEAVIRALDETSALLTVEEHREHGGLRSVVAEALLNAGAATDRVRTLAVPQDLRVGTGSQEHLREQAGLSVDDIIRSATELAGRR